MGAILSHSVDDTRSDISDFLIELDSKLLDIHGVLDRPGGAHCTPNVDREWARGISDDPEAGHGEVLCFGDTPGVARSEETLDTLSDDGIPPAGFGWSTAPGLENGRSIRGLFASCGGELGREVVTVVE